jgi:hypothetical protein
MKTSREKQIEKWLDEWAKKEDNTTFKDGWTLILSASTFIADKQHEADEKRHEAELQSKNRVINELRKQIHILEAEKRND